MFNGRLRRVPSVRGPALKKRPALPIILTHVLKLLAAPVLATALTGWFAFGSHDLSRGQVESAVKHQMNSGRAGVVTRSVHCSGKGTLSCVLTSTRGTTLRARVHVDGAQWRADWAPVSG